MPNALGAISSRNSEKSCMSEPPIYRARLSINQEKTRADHPDIIGMIGVAAEAYRVGLWHQTTRDGTREYYSGVLQQGSNRANPRFKLNGSFAELGFAHALGKPIWLTGPKPLPELWFIQQMATVTLIAESVSLAFRELLFTQL